MIKFIVFDEFISQGMAYLSRTQYLCGGWELEPVPINLRLPMWYPSIDLGNIYL